MYGKDKSYLHFTPEAEVELELEPSRKEQIGYIILKNISPAGVGFKFKCSNKHDVTVDPATGVLGPAEEKQVTVSYLNWHPDHSTHEKLQVLVAPLDDLYHADQNLHELFQRVATGDIQEHRLKVRPDSRKELYAFDKVQDNRKEQAVLIEPKKEPQTTSVLRPESKKTTTPVPVPLVHPEPKREPQYAVRALTDVKRDPQYAVQAPEVKKELQDTRDYRPTDHPVYRTEPQSTNYVQEPRPRTSTHYDRTQQSTIIRPYPHGVAYAPVSQRNPQKSSDATRRSSGQRTSIQVQSNRGTTGQRTAQDTYYHSGCIPPSSADLSTSYRRQAFSGTSSSRPEIRYRTNDAYYRGVTGPAEELRQRSWIHGFRSWFRERADSVRQLPGIYDVGTSEHPVRTRLFLLFVVALIVAIPLLTYSGYERHCKPHLVEEVSLFGESTVSATAAAVAELGGTLLEDRRARTLDEYIHWKMN